MEPSEDQQGCSALSTATRLFEPSGWINIQLKMPAAVIIHGDTSGQCAEGKIVVAFASKQGYQYRDKNQVFHVSRRIVKLFK